MVFEVQRCMSSSETYQLLMVKERQQSKNRIKSSVQTMKTMNNSEC